MISISGGYPDFYATDRYHARINGMFYPSGWFLWWRVQWKKHQPFWGTKYFI